MPRVRVLEPLPATLPRTRGCSYARDGNVPASTPVNDDGDIRIYSYERCFACAPQSVATLTNPRSCETRRFTAGDYVRGGHANPT
eukprot:1194280-Prorocentrum_minimum.AAC.4